MSHDYDPDFDKSFFDDINDTTEEDTSSESSYEMPEVWDPRAISDEAHERLQSFIEEREERMRDRHLRARVLRNLRTDPSDDFKDLSYSEAAQDWKDVDHLIFEEKKLQVRSLKSFSESFEIKDAELKSFFNRMLMHKFKLKLPLVCLYVKKDYLIISTKQNTISVHKTMCSHLILHMFYSTAQLVTLEKNPPPIILVYAALFFDYSNIIGNVWHEDFLVLAHTLREQLLSIFRVMEFPSLVKPNKKDEEDYYVRDLDFVVKTKTNIFDVGEVLIRTTLGELVIARSRVTEGLFVTFEKIKGDETKPDSIILPEALESVMSRLKGENFVQRKKVLDLAYNLCESSISSKINGGVFTVNPDGNFYYIVDNSIDFNSKLFSALDGFEMKEFFATTKFLTPYAPKDIRLQDFETYKTLRKKRKLLQKEQEEKLLFEQEKLKKFQDNLTPIYSSSKLSTAWVTPETKTPFEEREEKKLLTALSRLELERLSKLESKKRNESKKNPQVLEKQLKKKIFKQISKNKPKSPVGTDVSEPHFSDLLEIQAKIDFKTLEKSRFGTPNSEDDLSDT